jgi:Domain of unknown function (DUF4267)
MHARERFQLIFSLLGGVLLVFIGVRYFVMPEQASLTFGVPRRPVGHELHAIIALRNIWLGLLAVSFALLRQWTALALWFGLGVFVCFGDAAIVLSTTGRWPQIAFHVSCGIACIGLAVAAWRFAAK